MSRRFALSVVSVAAIAILAAGCGKKGDDSSDSKDGGGKSDGPRVGLVTDVGGLNDRSFNASANEGLEAAKKSVDATGSVIESKTASDYPTNLGNEVKQGSDLVVGVGFSMGDALKDAAAKAPKTNFAIVDNDYTGADGKWGATDNVLSLMFKENEAGYLAGVLAGQAEMDGTLKGLNKQHVLSVVGGMKIPPVDRYIVGFQQGVKAQCGDCKVLVDYSQDFVNQAKCQDLANSQIARGSDVVFQVAGGCGLGALDAAKTKKVWGIGVDVDQSFLGSHILTSAMKRIDTAVEQAITDVANDKFEGGKAITFGLAEDGVGLGDIAPAAQKYEKLVDDASEKISSGELTIKSA
jgi:basic membrane protein A